MSADLFPAYRLEALSLEARMAVLETDDACAHLMERWVELDDAVIATRPTTMPGALAALEMARRQYVQFEMNDDEAEDDRGHQIILSLLDGALCVLRQAAGGAAS